MAGPDHVTWDIPGADQQTILGDAHVPAEGETPRAVCLIIHGFLGYKDYGMFPHLAETCARAGAIAHRFNLSHSGMTANIETFERPDLFERDTWTRQVRDLDAVLDAIARDELLGAGLPALLIGHSRGGVTALLAAGRRFERDEAPLPAGVATMAAPDRCCLWDEQKQREHLEQGYTEVRSNRTGQTLRVGRAWLQELLDHPAAHDLTRHVRMIRCPMLFIHGREDPTVPPTCAHALETASSGRGEALLIDGGDHVFNTPNPFPPDAEPSPQLAAAERALRTFLGRVASP